jgi:hypothetical protein
MKTRKEEAVSNRMYIVNNFGEVELCPDLQKWGEWMSGHEKERYLAKDEQGQVRVSTVFLGLDHSFGSDAGKPLLWETMIFNGVHDGEQDRYSTKEEALAGHEKMKKKAFGGEA